MRDKMFIQGGPTWWYYWFEMNRTSGAGKPARTMDTTDDWFYHRNNHDTESGNNGELNLNDG